MDEERAQVDRSLRIRQSLLLKKTIEGAVEYAWQFGFRPHPDYGYTKRVLKGIDCRDCAANFEYGKDGKPFYVSGPTTHPPCL